MDLAEPLTAGEREVSGPAHPRGTLVLEPADDDVQPETVTVHGMLRNFPRLVTLVGASNVSRHQVWGGFVADPGEERLQADYVLLGEHESGVDARFTSATLRVRHLDAWAQLPGISGQYSTDGTSVTVTHEAPVPEQAEVAGLGGLVLGSVVTISDPTVRGGGFRRTAELCLDVSTAVTLDELWARFVAPVQVLLTLAVDNHSPPVSLEVRSADSGRWLTVVQPDLVDVDEDLLHVRDVLLTREHLGLAQVARWLSEAGELSPIPDVVATIATATGTTLANQLLELAAACEGLHRRLRPRDRVMSRGQADAARLRARDAVPEEVRERVNAALAHLEESAYAERLRYLTEIGERAAPGVTGDTAAWQRRVVAVRNGFAHQLPGRRDRTEDEMHEYLVLLRSLRWLLTTVLLQAAGVEPATLASQLTQHQPYLHLCRQAQRWLPAVYGNQPHPTTEGHT